MVLLLIAGSKLAGLSIPINTAKNIIQTNLSADESKTLEKGKRQKTDKP